METIGELQIRRAMPNDSDAIAGLLEQLGYPASGAEVPGRLHRLLTNDRAAVLLAQQGEKVVGLATAHVVSVLNRPRDVAWLTLLVVDESVRGSGIGRRLVRAIEDFARKLDCERLSVTTYEKLTGARAFYARLGFEETGRRFGKAL